MEKTDFMNMKEDFQGDEAGANDGIYFPKESPTPGPKGEDVPSIHEEEEIQFTTPQENFNRIRRGPGLLTIIGYFTLRIVFILAGLAILFFFGLYAAKLTGFFDPCDLFTVSSEDCIATPYMKGILYHVECTQQRKCFLPGFSYIVNTKSEDWSFNGLAK